MPPSIEEIPTASQLQQRLDILNNAVESLGQGAPVTNLTVGVPPNADPTILIMPMPITLDPPITNEETLTNLMAALTEQAEHIEAQLMAMGYAPPAKSASAFAEEALVSIKHPRTWPEPPQLPPSPENYTVPLPDMTPPPPPGP